MLSHQVPCMSSPKYLNSIKNTMDISTLVSVVLNSASLKQLSTRKSWKNNTSFSVDF